jgi:hypothetical protein
MVTKVHYRLKIRLLIKQLRKDKGNVGVDFNNGPETQEENDKSRVLPSNY